MLCQLSYSHRRLFIIAISVTGCQKSADDVPSGPRARCQRYLAMIQPCRSHFEFLMALSLVDGVILSGAVLQAERRISATTLCATGDPSARW